VEGVDQWTQDQELVERLLRFAGGEPRPPVLFFQTDGDLLAVSRHRERLSQAFRLTIAASALVEDLVDKSRFQTLAAELGLPVPASHHVHPATDDPDAVDLTFPLIVKPLSRAFSEWAGVEPDSKAIRADDRAALAALWRELEKTDLDVLLQQLIPGGEERIESYHAYIDGDGATAGEFTGRKIRTYPTEYGHSTAVETTRMSDVTELGREVLRRLGLRGVAKVDFKRAPDGRLHLLEVNPRFNLWHNVGALAGVNLPALVYADLVGLRRPPSGPVREGVRWCIGWTDRRAARDVGLPLRAWLRFAASAEATSVPNRTDPLPFLLGVLGPRVARRVRASLPARRASSFRCGPPP
jgi:predicted ATP-grasp superfamily ATP-dependent carboligase